METSTYPATYSVDLSHFDPSAGSCYGSRANDVQLTPWGHDPTGWSDSVSVSADGEHCIPMQDLSQTPSQNFLQNNGFAYVDGAQLNAHDSPTHRASAPVPLEQAPTAAIAPFIFPAALQPSVYPECNAGSASNNSPIEASTRDADRGPFVTIHISEYLDLLGRANVSSRNTYTSSTTSTIVPQGTDAFASTSGVPYAETTLPPLDTTGRSSGRKIACKNCHESRKTCDMGHPCGRCVRRGESANCIYIPHKRTRAPRRSRMTANTAGVELASAFRSGSVSLY